MIILAALGASTGRQRARGRTRRRRHLSPLPASSSSIRARAPAAFANALLFAAYIVLGHRVAQTSGFGGIDGLGRGDARRSRRCTARGLGSGAPPRSIRRSCSAAGIGVGIVSSVIPYVCDQSAMARLARSAYALLVAAPATTITARSSRRAADMGRCGRDRAGGRRDRGACRAEERRGPDIQTHPQRWTSREPDARSFRGRSASTAICSCRSCDLRRTVEPAGLEPATFWLPAKTLSQLSYGPEVAPSLAARTRSRPM